MHSITYIHIAIHITTHIIQHQHYTHISLYIYITTYTSLYTPFLSASRHLSKLMCARRCNSVFSISNLYKVINIKLSKIYYVWIHHCINITTYINTHTHYYTHYYIHTHITTKYPSYHYTCTYFTFFCCTN